MFCCELCMLTLLGSSTPFHHQHNNSLGDLESKNYSTHYKTTGRNRRAEIRTHNFKGVRGGRCQNLRRLAALRILSRTYEPS